MQKRYFIVREVAKNEYETREVSSDVAFGVQQFVTTMGQCRQSAQEEWIFFFMYMNISVEHANDIASVIVDKLCSEHMDCSREVAATIVTSNGCKPGYDMNSESDRYPDKPSNAATFQRTTSPSPSAENPTLD
ncbi:MAG: hypothetical protein KC546_06150 [Anaerolineae bacterium]|nr:hypothetical protein [Anaerolineae bacterium]MCA9893713.1 hypothetical protein [Anaerolineae bacterium]